MATPKAYSIRPQGDYLAVVDAFTNGTWCSFHVPGGAQSFHLSGIILTAIGKDGRIHLFDLDRKLKIRG